MKGRTREQLYLDVINIILDATTDPDLGGVFGRKTLADLASCSTATLTAEMPNIVAKSKEVLPGYCVEIGEIKQNRGRPIYRYRVVDRQSVEEFTMSKRRGRKAETVLQRLINEVDVLKAGPGSRAAVSVMEAGVDMVERGLKMLEESAGEIA